MRPIAFVTFVAAPIALAFVIAAAADWRICGVDPGAATSPPC